MGASTAVEKEGCFACAFVVRKAYELLVKSADNPKSLAPTVEDFSMAVVAACDNVPLVFLQACNSLKEQSERVATDFIGGASFANLCSNAQLCWSGLMQ